MKRKRISYTLAVVSIIAFSLVPVSSSAQHEYTSGKMQSFLYFQPNIGASQYFGDINKPDFSNSNFKLGYGAVLGYQVSRIFGVRGQFLKTELYGKRTDQNLKFKSDLWDAGLNVTVNINEIFSKQYNDKRFLNFYLFTGAGLTSYKSNLESITPGPIINQHAERQKEIFVPLGAGASFRLNNSLSINLEYGDHMTFKSDQIDFTDGNKRNDHYSYASAGLQIRFDGKDTDGDGIKDKEAACPEIAGKVELAGCPDKDNDGIADKDDACPDLAGKADFKGCPDTDEDGIPDKDDACPGLAGKAELKGCPDLDGDGIADNDDKCPDMAGKIDFNGCPDRDGDGITDMKDACPDVKGLAQYSGCPDTDGDGIPDNKDNCPEAAGIADNNGCPKVAHEPLLEKSVYFISDGAVVIDKHMTALNEIAAFMAEHPDAVVSVSGYADDRESEEYNLRLSEKRADFVINYLMKKGIAATKIERSFFGKSKPVADNKTASGRTLNRRVEIRITK